MIGKNLRKLMKQFLLIFCILKKKKISCLYLKHSRNRGKQIILLIVSNRKELEAKLEGQRLH